MEEQVAVPSRMFVGPELALVPAEVDSLMAEAGLTARQRSLVLLHAAEWEPDEVAALIAGQDESAHPAFADMVRPWGGRRVSRQGVRQSTIKALVKLRRAAGIVTPVEAPEPEQPERLAQQHAAHGGGGQVMQDIQQQFVTVAQAAREFNTTEAAIRNRMRRGQFHIHPVGYARLLERDEVRRVAARSTR